MSQVIQLPRLTRRKEPALAYTLALPDKALNPLRIKPPEGEMMAIKQFNPDGPLDRIVASIAGWHFRYEESVPDHELWKGGEVDKWELLPDLNPRTKKRVRLKRREQSMPEKEFGLIVIGPGKAIYVPHLRYSKWEKKPGTTETEMVSKDLGDYPYFFFQYNMGIPVVAVESKGNIKTTIEMNVHVRMVNPYKALFLAGGWESVLNAAIADAVRDHLSDLTIDEIREEKSEGKLTKRIMLLNEKKDGFTRKFGISITDVRFVGFKVVGGKDVEKAVEGEEIARLQAKTAVHEGNKIVTIATAEAKAAKKIVDVFGANAAQVQIMQLFKEAVLGTKLSTLVLGGDTPVAVTASSGPTVPPSTPEKPEPTGGAKPPRSK